VKQQKSLSLVLRTLFMCATGLVFLIVPLLFMAEFMAAFMLESSDVKPGSVHAWFVDKEVRRLPPVDGLVLQRHAFAGRDGETAGFDESVFLIASPNFDLCPWADYWVALGYAKDAQNSHAQGCAQTSVNFKSQAQQDPVHIAIHVDQKAQNVIVTKR
jgi:hypothetical protein